MSNASVDLPEPLTPVTHVRALSGILISRFFKLFCLAPRIWMNLASLAGWVIGICPCAPARAARVSLQAIFFHENTAEARAVNQIEGFLFIWKQLSRRSFGCVV